MTKDYIVDRCNYQQPNDQNSFIQVKYYHDNIYVYCPENNITVNNKTEPCPSHEAFLVPANVDFIVNGMKYIGSKEITLEHEEKSDPMFTFHTNWHMQPTLHIKQIMGDIEKTDALLNSADKLREQQHNFRTVDRYHFGLTGFLIVILLLFFGTVLLKRYFGYKPETKRVQIRARRVRFNDEPDIIEIEPMENQREPPSQGSVGNGVLA